MDTCRKIKEHLFTLDHLLMLKIDAVLTSTIGYIAYANL